MKHLRILTAAAVIAVLLCCRGRTELQQTCQIAGISVDRGVRLRERYSRTLFADVYHADRQTVSSYLLSTEGDTLRDALAALDRVTDGTPVLQHCGMILLQKEIAARPADICAVLTRDWSGQSPYVAVADRGSAAELLGRREQQDLRARSVREHLKNSAVTAGIETPHLEQLTAAAGRGRPCDLPSLAPSEKGSRLAGTFRAGEKYEK